MTPLGIELVTFWLVARCLNQLCHGMPLSQSTLVFSCQHHSTSALYFHLTPTIHSCSKWQHCQIKHTFKKWKWLWTTYWSSWMAWYESAMSKSSVRGWFMNNFIVFGPLSCGALIFSECTFTACVNVMDMINWNNTRLVLQTFQTYLKHELYIH